MAAGMTLAGSRASSGFRARLRRGDRARAPTRTTLAGVDPRATASCCRDEMSLETARVLRGAGPWGQGFPEPVFDGGFKIADLRVVGGRHLKLRLRGAPRRAAARRLRARAAGARSMPLPSATWAVRRQDPALERRARRSSSPTAWR